jgi:folate-binding protein YgfZ
MTTPTTDQPGTATPTPRSPLLDAPGAVEAQGQDAGVAWHYGDPVREQRLLEAGEAAVDLSNRGVLTVTGPDRLSWLNSLTSQSLLGLAPGEAAETLILSPHGHVEHDLHVVDDGTTTWLTVEPGSTGAVAGWLDRMRFMLRVEVADVTASWAVVGAAPDLARRLAAGSGGTPAGTTGEPAPPVWVDPWPALGASSASYAAVDEATHPGRERPFAEVLVPRDRLTEVLTGVPLAGTWASEASRVAAWRPRQGLETDHRTIPHEADWLRTAVHLQKGCYRGQETVARVHNLGRPPRRLVFLHLDGSQHTLPAHGDPVSFGGRQVGFVTTAARHHELGPVALALVKRSLPVDAVLLVGGSEGEVSAAQEVVVAP